MRVVFRLLVTFAGRAPVSVAVDCATFRRLAGSEQTAGLWFEIE